MEYKARELARRRMMGSLRLTEAERDTCAGDLAEQYAIGRLDDAELGRRVDMLHRAVTHADLSEVFAGLPAPQLYSTPARSGRWRWLVFVGAAWMASPFLLIGLVLAVVGREVGALIFVLPALVWLTVFWRWARAKR